MDANQPTIPAAPGATVVVSSPSLTDATQLKFLEPRRLKFFKAGAALRLTMEGECSYLRVKVQRAFPLSLPQRYLSVRDDGNKEIGVLIDPEALDPESRRLVAAELERRYLVSTIRRICSVTERFGVVEWEVETDRGPREFTTRDLRDHVLQPAEGQFVFTDVDENRYTVACLGKLDANSQTWLLRHVS